MLERNEKGKQVRRYFIELEKRYRLAQRIAMEQREKVLQILQEQSERIDGLEHKLSGYFMGINSFGFNPFNPGSDILDQRMRTLNSLIDQVADLSSMERNKVLHFLYKTMQECLGVTLNPYLTVMKSERRDESICNLHVIAGVDRFYEKAVEMCQDVVERKNLFG